MYFRDWQYLFAYACVFFFVTLWNIRTVLKKKRLIISRMRSSRTNTHRILHLGVSSIVNHTTLSCSCVGKRHLHFNPHKCMTWMVDDPQPNSLLTNPSYYHAYVKFYPPSTTSTRNHCPSKRQQHYSFPPHFSFIHRFRTFATLSSRRCMSSTSIPNVVNNRRHTSNRNDNSQFQLTLDTGKNLIISLVEEKTETSLKDALIVWLQLLQTFMIHTTSNNHDRTIIYNDLIHVNELLTMLVIAQFDCFPSHFPAWVQSVISQIQETVNGSEDDNLDTVKHGIVPYNEILACLCKCKSVDAAIMGERLLQPMLLHSQRTAHNTNFSPLEPKSSKLCIFSVNSVLSCWKNILTSFVPSTSQVLPLEDIESRVLRLWDEFFLFDKIDDSRHYDEFGMIPNRITVQTTLSILRSIAKLQAEGYLLKQGLPITSYHHAKRILESMIDRFQSQRNIMSKTILPAALQDYSELETSSSDHAWKPNKENFHTLLSILGYTNDNEWIQMETNTIINNMKKLAKDLNEEDLNPDLLIFKTIIGLLLKSSSFTNNKSKFAKNKDKIATPRESNLPLAISDIVHEAVEKFGWAPIDDENDGDSSNSLGHFLIITLANSGYPEEAYKVLHFILEEFHRTEDATKASRTKPNLFCWNAVMSAFALKGKVDQAVHVLHEIQDCHAAGHDDIRPDNVSLSILLKLLLQQKDPAIGDKALLILQRMEDKSKKQDHVHLKPDIITYASVIECVLKSRSDKAIEKAREILIQRINEYKSGVSDVRPDGRLFKRVIAAHLDRFPDGPFDSTEILFSHFESGEYIHLDDASDMFECYTTLLHRYCEKANTFEFLLKAEKLLSRLEFLHEQGVEWIFPRTKHYNWVLDALARQGHLKATKLAKDILSRMELKFETGLSKIKPDSYSYSAVLLAIANGSSHQSRALEAEVLLQHVLKIASNSDGDSLSVQLTSIIFNNAIRAVERSGTSDKRAKVRNIIKAMTDRGMKPDTFTYNGAIRCCAYTTGEDREKREAFEYALSCLKQLRSSDSTKVDLYTYPAIFIACDKLLSNNEQDVQNIMEIWRMCCDDGCVSDLILSQLRKMKVSLETLRILLQNEDAMSIGVTSLPKRWTRFYHRRTKTLIK